jgi:hypothetical protein
VSKRPKAKRDGLPIDAVDAEWVELSARQEQGLDLPGDEERRSQILRSRQHNIDWLRSIRKILHTKRFEGSGELDSFAYFRRLIKHYQRAARNAKDIGPRTGG